MEVCLVSVYIAIGTAPPERFPFCIDKSDINHIRQQIVQAKRTRSAKINDTASRALSTGTAKSGTAQRQVSVVLLRERWSRLRYP